MLGGLLFLIFGVGRECVGVGGGFRLGFLYLGGIGICSYLVG